ncbi:MAG: hypothetical protein B7Z36_05440 [Novosphingobium sp. 12-63-9]|nr:MAG: hypothetical protein B7Z36_05440 [Novosphingobium sp. 12-63-9]
MDKPHLTVLVNRQGGAASAAGDALPESIVAGFATAGTTADVRMLDGQEMAKAIKQAARQNARIVVAGGDGTIACAAQAMAGTDTELAVLPLGTLNHFARDLAIPTDLAQAAALAANGTARGVDVAEVSGHRFINNASIGIYPVMVEWRDSIRHRHGVPKWLASIPAAWEALAHMRSKRLRIDRGKGDEALVTPLLFIGNNRYSLDPWTLGSRPSLTDGKMSVYAVARSRRLSLIWFGLRALVGKVDRMRDFEALGEMAALDVRGSGARIEIALDGEVRHLPSPLEFRILPGALRVVAPPSK